MNSADLSQRLALRAAQLPAGSPDRALLLEAARALLSGHGPPPAPLRMPSDEEGRRVWGSQWDEAVPCAAWCEGPALDAGELDRSATLPGLRKVAT